VAPILSPDGCIGAFSVEVRSGEPSDTVQALAAIVAAQLATVLEPAEAEVLRPRLAASS
jgi:GAF domain-containing protein